MINDNLGSLFEGDPSAPKPMSLRQGVVEEWDASTGDNTISVAGGLLVNVPVLTSESASLAHGDVVSLLTTDDRVLLLGKVTTPGDPGTVPTWIGDLTALAPLVPLAAVTDGLVMTGAINASADSGTGPRVVINDPAYPGEVVLYTDDPNEIAPGRIKPVVSGVLAYLRFFSPKTSVPDSPTTLNLWANGTTGQSGAELDADVIHLFGTTTTIDGFSSLKLGDGSDYVTITGNDVTGADLSSASNVFPAALATLTGSQTLTNKDLTGAGNTFPTSLATLTGTQTLTNKNLSDSSNIVPAYVATLTGSQTLANKDLTASTNTFPGQMLTQVLTATCSTNVDVTTTEVDITGATVTFSTTKTNAKYLVTGSFYFAAILANTGVASGKLSVDGSVQTPFANFTGTNATFDRTNSSQTWSGTLASTGSHTLKLRGVGSAAAPNPAQRINSGSTTITVLVFE